MCTIGGSPKLFHVISTSKKNIKILFNETPKLLRNTVLHNIMYQLMINSTENDHFLSLFFFRSKKWKWKEMLNYNHSHPTSLLSQFGVHTVKKSVMLRFFSSLCALFRRKVGSLNRKSIFIKKEILYITYMSLKKFLCINWKDALRWPSLVFYYSDSKQLHLSRWNNFSQ